MSGEGGTRPEAGNGNGDEQPQYLTKEMLEAGNAQPAAQPAPQYLQAPAPQPVHQYQQAAAPQPAQQLASQSVQQPASQPAQQATVPPQVAVPQGYYVTRDVLEDEMRAIQRQLDLRATRETMDSIIKWRAELCKELEVLQNDLTSLRQTTREQAGKLNEIRENVLEKFGHFELDLKAKTDKTDAKRRDRELMKIDHKIADIMEEVGFGESLDVSKIPPNILEIVYQTTLDDVVNELFRNLGPHDAEQVVRDTLEDVRLRTSGSELFRFDGRRIRTRELARAIEQKLISAKQIQTTYSVLLERMLEYIPTHKAKNFRAMIKIKSQEYAVDKTTKLLEYMAKIEENVSNVNRMSAALSAHLNAKARQLEDRFMRELKGLQGKLDGDLAAIAAKLDGLEASAARSSAMEGLEQRLTVIEDKLHDMREKDEMELVEEAMGAPMPPPPEGTVGPDDAISEEREETAEAAEERTRNEFLELENEILGAIPEPGGSMTAISKAAGMNRNDVKIILEQLVGEGRAHTVKKGKTKYYYPGPHPKDDGILPTGEADEEEPSKKKSGSKKGKGKKGGKRKSGSKKGKKGKKAGAPPMFSGTLVLEAEIETRASPKDFNKVEKEVWAALKKGPKTTASLKKLKSDFSDVEDALQVLRESGFVSLETKGGKPVYKRLPTDEEE